MSSNGVGFERVHESPWYPCRKNEIDPCRQDRKTESREIGQKEEGCGPTEGAANLLSAPILGTEHHRPLPC